MHQNSLSTTAFLLQHGHFGVRRPPAANEGLVAIEARGSIMELRTSTRSPAMVNNMSELIGELNPPTRLMLTPGPSSIDPRVYRALATPLVGHLDPWFKVCMDETQLLLRQVFQTENRLTMPLSASGSGGIEASVLNALEDGDEA